MELFPDGSNAWVLIPLTFVGVIILILLCQRIWVGGVQPGGVVLCILLFNTPVDTYISYALSRIFDTGVGVVAAWRSTACSEEMEDLTGEIKAFIFCHPENLASRRTAEKLCHLYPEHFQLVLEEL